MFKTMLFTRSCICCDFLAHDANAEPKHLIPHRGASSQHILSPRQIYRLVKDERGGPENRREKKLRWRSYSSVHKAEMLNHVDAFHDSSKHSSALTLTSVVYKWYGHSKEEAGQVPTSLYKSKTSTHSNTITHQSTLQTSREKWRGKLSELLLYKHFFWLIILSCLVG
jgi:hypothetical protein